MNNEDKAREISSKYNERKDIFGKEIYDIGYEACCLEMAQWKDEQFSKFLLWLDDYYVIRKFDDGEPMTYAELIDSFKNMNK